MARLLYGNFDFEHELATPHYNRPQRLARLNAELTPSLIALAENEDQIWCPEPLPKDYAEQLASAGLPTVSFRSPDTDCQVTPDVPVVLQPWGWSAAALDFARQIDVDVPPVDLDAVRTANSREFSFAIEHELDTAPPGTIRLESSRQLIDAIAQSAAVWNRPAAEHRIVLKANFGMSGRERFVLRGDEALTPSVHGWINRRVEQSGAVFLEPWLDSLGEFSTHWEIAPPEATANTGSGTAQAVRSIATATHGSASQSSERVRFIGQTQLLNTPHGQYSGSRVGVASTALPDDETERLLSEIKATAEQAAVSVSQLGYTGPLGIDAMIYRNADGALRTRPVQDINARWSMGRIALALQAKLSSQNCMSLLMTSSRKDWDGRKQARTLPSECRLINLIPTVTGDRPSSVGVVAVVAESAERLAVVERQITGQRTS